MASKVKAQAAKEEAPEKEAEGAPDTPLPLLDLTDAGVKKMIKAAKKRGYVTHEQINAVLPSEEVTSDQIEDIFAMISEMGINVVENEEPTPRKARRRPPTRRPTTTRTTPAPSWSSPRPSRSPPPRRKSRPSAPTIPCACICARWARSSSCRARAKSPSPSASRPAARP